MKQSSGIRSSDSQPIPVTLEARPERRLIRPRGSARHVDFVVRVGPAPIRSDLSRTPLDLALVLDRSGSMSGEKIATAKRAALAVVERLDQCDRVAVVVFDDWIEVVQPLVAAAPIVKETLRARLATIEARASTALHEGWLTGAHQVAADVALARQRLARVFLLTDGLANVGLQDSEAIAGQAAGLRQSVGIGTSTFGIGDDYNEGLLGPMAVAGGGQFHHLRGTADLAATFVGELGDLFAVAAREARLELRVAPEIVPDVVSAYHVATNIDPEGLRRVEIAIGDLLPSDERHVVARFGFPAFAGAADHQIAARLAWRSDDGERVTDWQTLQLTYADDRTCSAEARDPAVMRWVALHHAERARREATALNRQGDWAGARNHLRKVANRIRENAGDDPELRRLVQELKGLGEVLADAPMPLAMAKEVTYQAYRTSRGLRDHRAPPA